MRGSVFVARRRKGDDADDDPVATLLARQCCLGRLVVGDARALPAAARTAGAGLRRLRELVLEELGTDSKAVRAMGKALGAGGAPVLQVLEVRESARPDVRLLPIVAALKNGACPNLRRLLLGSSLGLPAMNALFEALLFRHPLWDSWSSAPAANPLRSLDLSIGAQGFPDNTVCAAVIARMVSLVRQDLEELAVEGFGPLASGVVIGLQEVEAAPFPLPPTAPKLRRLRLSLVLYERHEFRNSSLLLARGLGEKGLTPSLAVLELGGVWLRGQGLAALVGGVEGQQHLTALTELRLVAAGLTTTDATDILAPSLRRCPEPWRRLTRLDLGGNRGLCCAGVAALAEHLGPGRALGGLEALVLERCCRGDAGAVALFQALARSSGGEDVGRRWRLRELSLGGCGLGPGAMQGLNEVLSLSSSFSSSEAANEASDRSGSGGATGAWAESLLQLSLCKNALGTGFSELVAALIAAGPKLALQWLDLWATGMGKDGAAKLAKALWQTEAVAPDLQGIDFDHQDPRLDEASEAAVRAAVSARQRRASRKT